MSGCTDDGGGARDAGATSDPSVVPDAAVDAAAGADPGAQPCGMRIPQAGPFVRIHDPSVDELTPWYINDHSIVLGPDQRWHLFGITDAEPALSPKDEVEFAHASSAQLTAPMWTKHDAAMRADESMGEKLLWAPHVIVHDGLYYMFYTAGGDEGSAYQMRLATSPDLLSWLRDPGPLFVDGFEARDPFVMRVGDRWVMYYTATDDPAGGHHVVAYRTSADLRSWSERAIAYRDVSMGTGAGPTESPFVVARDEGFYLFIGPREDYVSTTVYFSADPLAFQDPPITQIEAHAPEVVRDLDGRAYISRAGWGQGGVDLAPLTWKCRAPAAK
ncbi:MAG TPA: family 43 glycosylhydrolase [Polyangiales bacterium]